MSLLALRSWGRLSMSAPGRGSGPSDDGSSCTAHPEDLDVLDAAFAVPALTVICRLDELGLVDVGRRLDLDRTVIEYWVAQPGPWWRGCGCGALQARVRDLAR